MLILGSVSLFNLHDATLIESKVFLWESFACFYFSIYFLKIHFVCFDFQQMASEFQQDSAVGIIGAVNRHLLEAEQVKNSGNTNW